MNITDKEVKRQLNGVQWSEFRPSYKDVNTGGEGQ